MEPHLFDPHRISHGNGGPNQEVRKLRGRATRDSWWRGRPPNIPERIFYALRHKRNGKADVVRAFFKMPVAPGCSWSGYEDISTLECPGRSILSKRKPSPLHESDRDILGDFGFLIAVHTMCGMIKSFDSYRGASEDCDRSVHLVPVNVARKCKKLLREFFNIGVAILALANLPRWPNQN